MYKGLTFVVGNDRTSVYDADAWTTWLFDRELRYPTAVAEAREGGWRPPVDEPGEWDGWVRLFRQPKTMPAWFPTGLFAYVQRLCWKMALPYTIEDARQRPEGGIPEFPKEPLADRDYQIPAVEAALKEGRGVLDLPPRSGKTRIMMEIVGKLGLRTIWIAPTDIIVRQTIRAIEEAFGESFAHHQVGVPHERTKDDGTVELVNQIPERRVILCTAATAVRLPPTFYETREVLVVDEWHHSAAKTYHEIVKLCGHIFYRFGMTGTFFRSGDDAMAMHALLSNTIYKVNSSELLARGYLVPTRVVYVPVEAPRLQCPGADGRIAPWLKYGVQEHDIRNQLVAYCAAYLLNLGRKVLVLVSTKVQGRRLARMIEGQIPERTKRTQYKRIEFISTDRKKSVQQGIIKAFNESSEVQVLIGTSLLGEGIDLPPADALVYARGEKAEVALTQNAYRVCTAYEGKHNAIVVDFADRHNRHLIKHSSQRLQTFYEDPVFDVEVLPSVKYFGIWCRRNVRPALDQVEATSRS